MGDEAREPGQAPSVHFNPLVEVVPPRAPRPVVKVVFVNARLQRKRPVLQKDPESSKMNVIFFFFMRLRGRGGGVGRENEEGDF